MPRALPEELIENVCRNLCFHCCHPGAFPNADTLDVKQSKAALARLCRASKQCARIAQPILYHYYATGNLPSQQELGLPDDHHSLCSEDDKLPAFLRTVIDRPDLAQLVLTMQLVGSDNISGCTDKLVRIFERASDQVGMDYPPKEFWLQDVLGSREDYLEEHGDLHPGRCTIHHWLEELCILLTPNVTTLLLARNLPGPFDRLIEAYNNGRSGPLLPSLRTLALRSLSSAEWRPDNPRALFKNAPNLQTFYCMQAAVTDAYLERFPSSYGGLHLFERVRTLVLSNPDDGDLMDVLAALPALEELECLWMGRDFPTFPGYGTLLRGCRNRKGTPLRRLRCGWAPNNYDAEYPAPEHYELAFDGDRYSTVRPEELLPLDQLEELTIDQAAFHYAGYVRPDVEEDNDESDSGNRRLVDILPRSLRDLHLIYVYRDMTADLVELARQCLASTFAHLRKVRISLTERPNPARIPGLEEMRSAVDVTFADGPVNILWGPTSMIGGDPMMVVPGGTAVAKLIEPPTLIHHLPDGGAGYDFERTMRERAERIEAMQ